MSPELSRATMILLLAVHAILALWGAVGLVQWFTPRTPWPTLSNALFPRDVLLMQWLLTLTAAAVFLVGYARRWEYTPTALACTYAAMAALCAVETFRSMEGGTRFLAMGLEYVAYAAILLFLFRSRVFEKASR